MIAILKTLDEFRWLQFRPCCAETIRSPCSKVNPNGETYPVPLAMCIPRDKIGWMKKICNTKGVRLAILVKVKLLYNLFSGPVTAVGFHKCRVLGNRERLRGPPPVRIFTLVPPRTACQHSIHWATCRKCQRSPKEIWTSDGHMKASEVKMSRYTACQRMREIWQHIRRFGLKGPGGISDRWRSQTKFDIKMWNHTITAHQTRPGRFKARVNQRSTCQDICQTNWQTC